MTDRGFTLIELVAVSVLVFGVASVAGTIAVNARSADRGSQRYSQQLHDARRALASLESDLRAASAFRATRDGVELTVSGRLVHWRAFGTKLERNGHTLARAIASLQVERVDHVFQIVLELATGPRDNSRPAPVIVSAVAARRHR